MPSLIRINPNSSQKFHIFLGRISWFDCICDISLWFVTVVTYHYFYSYMRSKYKISGRFIEFEIQKVGIGEIWPRLMVAQKKPAWLKIDFDHFAFDDSEEEKEDEKLTASKLRKSFWNVVWNTFSKYLIEMNPTHVGHTRLGAKLPNFLKNYSCIHLILGGRKTMDGLTLKGRWKKQRRQVCSLQVIMQDFSCKNWMMKLFCLEATQVTLDQLIKIYVVFKFAIKSVML